MKFKKKRVKHLSIKEIKLNDGFTAYPHAVKQAFGFRNFEKNELDIM